MGNNIFMYYQNYMWKNYKLEIQHITRLYQIFDEISKNQ